MMNLADLGPKLDPDQPDSEPVAVKSWSLLTELNGWNEAVCTFRVRHLRDGVELTLLVFVNPRTLAIQRASALLANGDSITLNLRDYPMPGIVADVAATMVRNRFQPNAPIRAWTA